MSCARPVDGNVSKVKLGDGPLLLSAVPPSRSGVMRDAASSSDGSGAVSRASLSVDAAAPAAAAAPPLARRQLRVVGGDAPAPAGRQTFGIGSFGFRFGV